MRFEKTPDGALPATAAPSILACRATAYALGCGLKKTPDTVSLTQRLIASAARPIVLDADGLNCIAEDKSVLLHKKSDIIITPHVGEMSRLTGIGVKEIALSRVQTARRFAEEYGVTVVLKGHETVIAAPGGETYVNTTGNAGMAKGGSGDILAGMIAGFSAQGFSPALAAACGVYLHGAAGDIAAERYSEWAMLPDDLSNCLPDAFKAVLNG